MYVEKRCVFSSSSHAWFSVKRWTFPMLLSSHIQLYSTCSDRPIIVLNKWRHSLTAQSKFTVLRRAETGWSGRYPRHWNLCRAARSRWIRIRLTWGYSICSTVCGTSNQTHPLIIFYVNNNRKYLRTVGHYRCWKPQHSDMPVCNTPFTKSMVPDMVPASNFHGGKPGGEGFQTRICGVHVSRGLDSSFHLQRTG